MRASSPWHRCRESPGRDTSDRARLLQAYLTQPFFVAEQWSGRPGVSVTLGDALRDVRRIMAGEADALPPAQLHMGGRLPA